jgi:hypothetical protein
MVDLTDATDAELADRFARCDSRVRAMKTWGPIQDQLEKVMEEIRAEQARRMEAEGDG